MNITITYCGVWNYLPKAQVVSSELRTNFKDINIELIKGSSGVFDVMLMGDSYDTADRLVFSKHIKGRFPGDGEITRLLK